MRAIKGERQVDIEPSLIADARSIGALHGSARGMRNIEGRLRAMGRLRKLEGGRLLDVGCATGEYTRVLARGFDRVDAIDIERNRLDHFRTSGVPGGVHLAIQSVYDLEYDDSSFDVISMIEVLEHLERPLDALIELRRVLKPGGAILLTTPNRIWPFEQHGILIGERRIPGYSIPGVTWCKPLHRRLSRSDAFLARDLRRLADGVKLELEGVTYMMPPLDSLGVDHPAHTALDRLEKSMFAGLGQTIVGSMTKT